MLKTLALINFALAAFDVYLTRRRMHDYGIWIELNKTIQKLSEMLGIESGILLGIMIPVAAQTILFYWLNWPVAFGLLIGFRFKLFITQLYSLQFEKQLKAKKNELELEAAKLGARSQSPRSPLQRDSTQQGDDTMGPSISNQPPSKGPNGHTNEPNERISED